MRSSILAAALAVLIVAPPAVVAQISVEEAEAKLAQKRAHAATQPADQVNELRALVADLRSEIADLKRQIESLKRENAMLRKPQAAVSDKKRGAAGAKQPPTRKEADAEASELKKGMTYDQVLAIFGKPRQSDTGADGRTVAMWMHQEGAHALKGGGGYTPIAGGGYDRRLTVFFVDGKVDDFHLERGSFGRARFPSEEPGWN